MESDDSLSVEQMEKQFYQGYPLWRKDKYKAQTEILKNIISE
jgi:hypothetical protein